MKGLLFQTKIKSINFLTTITTSILLASVLLNCNDSNNNLTQGQEEQIKKEVRKSFESLTEATETLDWDAYFSHFDKELFSGLNADGTTWSSFVQFKKSVLPALQMIKTSEELSFPVVKLTVLNPNTVILVNEYVQTILLQTDDTVQTAGGGTQVWHKKDNDWKLVSISASAKSGE